MMRKRGDSEPAAYKKIIAVDEIHRISRSLAGENTSLSCWPLLSLIELSRYQGWQRYSDIFKVIDDKFSVPAFLNYRKKLESMGLVDTKTQPSSGSRFPSVLVRAKNIRYVNADDYEGRKTLALHNAMLIYMNQFRQTRNRLFLVMYAAKIRKIDNLAEMADFCNDKNSASCGKLLVRAAELGLLGLIKSGDARNNALNIFDVE